MCYTRLLCTIGLTLWSGLVAASQSASSVELSGPLRVHLREDRFGIVTSIRGLPLGVRDGLQRLFGSQTLGIAEPGAAFQATNEIRQSEAADPPVGRGGVLDRSLPRLLRARRLCDTRGRSRCFTGRPPRLGSSGALRRQAASRQSTTFGTPFCLGRSRARTRSGVQSRTGVQTVTLRVCPKQVECLNRMTDRSAPPASGSPRPDAI